jgi:hypothetical protein
MRTAGYVLIAVVMTGAWLLTASPASAAWPDNMPHLGIPSGCGSQTHLPSGTQLTANYTFRLCVGNSQATTWSWTVKRKSDGLVLPCSIYNQPVSVNTLNCTNIPPGVYSVTVAYMVGTSPGPSHPDCWYLKP